MIGAGNWRYIFLICLAVGVPLMLAPTKGVWDVTVSGDDITIRKCFLLKKHWNFSELEWAKRTRGGLKCYARGRKRMAFFVDSGDDITIRKCFLLKKHWNFSELEWAKRTRGGLKCYARGRKRMAFFVDAMTDHFSNFEARLQEEHIPIR